MSEGYQLKAVVSVSVKCPKCDLIMCLDHEGLVYCEVEECELKGKYRINEPTVFIESVEEKPE